MSQSPQAAEWRTGNDKLIAAALAKKEANYKAAAAGAAREARTVAYIRKYTDLPLVAISQGFAAGESGKIAGLPTDHGIEPALADIRLERVHQKHPAHVHIEVSGTSFGVGEKDHLFVKVEKLRQQERTGDDKLIMLVMDKFRDKLGNVGPKAIMLHVPKGALDLSGDVSQRYNDPKGIHTRVVQGQLMLALPPDTKFRLTREQFILHIETALNKGRYDKMTPEQKEADRAFHAALQADKPKLGRLNGRYMQERAQMTLRGGAIAKLDGIEQAKLRSLGALNHDALVREYRQAVGLPELTKDRSLRG